MFEHFMNRNISGLIDETLERTCLFRYTSVDGIGLVSALFVMTKLLRELEFLDEARASDIVQRFQKKKRGKNVAPRGIDFLKSFLNI